MHLARPQLHFHFMLEKWASARGRRLAEAGITDLKEEEREGKAEEGYGAEASPFVCFLMGPPHGKGELNTAVVPHCPGTLVPGLPGGSPVSVQRGRPKGEVPNDAGAEGRCLPSAQKPSDMVHRTGHWGNGPAPPRPSLQPTA